MKMAYIEKADRVTYLKLLAFLGDNCDSFDIVEYYPSKEINEYPSIIKSLWEHLINKGKVSKWPGTEVKCAYNETPVQYTFLCNKNSLEVLTNLSWFSDIEIDCNMDISFYKNRAYVLYEVCHENICVVDLNFFENISSGLKVIRLF